VNPQFLNEFFFWVGKKVVRALSVDQLLRWVT